jgi:hypothetical protein
MSGGEHDVRLSELVEFVCARNPFQRTRLGGCPKDPTAYEG